MLSFHLRMAPNQRTQVRAAFQRDQSREQPNRKVLKISIGWEELAPPTIQVGV